MKAIFRILLFSLFMLMFSAGHAVTPDNDVKPPVISAESQAARDDVKKILDGPDFNREKTKRSWRFKDTDEIKEDEEIPEWLIRFIEFLEEYFTNDSDEESTSNIGVLIAKVMEFILWVSVISLVFFLLYYYRDFLKLMLTDKGTSKKQSFKKPEVLFGLDIRQESLPEDVPQQVLSLWRDGAARESLGLLYRATLSGLIHQYNFKFTESATENECADIVNHSGMMDIYNYLKMLTTIWQRLAYGHRMPQESDVMALCKSWPEIFSNEK